MRLEGGGAWLPEVPQRDADGGTNHLQKFTAKPVEFKTKAPTDFLRKALKVEYSRHLRLIDAYQKPFKLNVYCHVELSLSQKNNCHMDETSAILHQVKPYLGWE